MPAGRGARGALHELLDLADVGQHQGLHVLAERGKGETEKNVRVPLNHETMRALDHYLPARAAALAAALAGRPATPALLVSPTRVARLTRQAAYGRIARVADAAGVGPLARRRVLSMDSRTTMGWPPAVSEPWVRPQADYRAPASTPWPSSPPDHDPARRR